MNLLIRDVIPGDIGCLISLIHYSVVPVLYMVQEGIALVVIAKIWTFGCLCVLTQIQQLLINENQKHVSSYSNC